MPIQLAADIAPNGARHSVQRPGDPTAAAAAPRPSVAYVDSHTVRKHRTWRHRPLATASMAAITDAARAREGRRRR